MRSSAIDFHIKDPTLWALAAVFSILRVSPDLGSASLTTDYLAFVLGERQVHGLSSLCLDHNGVDVHDLFGKKLPEALVNYIVLLQSMILHSASTSPHLHSSSGYSKAMDTGPHRAAQLGKDDALLLF